MSSDHGGKLTVAHARASRKFGTILGSHDHRKIGVNIEAPCFWKNAICNC